MFIGRKKELEHLNNLYKSNKFEFAVIYGRRRIGKTTLINEFVKDKNNIYFTGIEGNEKENLENLSKSIYENINKSHINSIFRNFEDALTAIFEESKNKRIVLIIDEYPYLASSYKAISSILQLLIDKYKESSKLFLILCGSSLSFMEEQVLGYKSPLYGRRTAQYKISKFDFFEFCEYYKNFNIYDLVTIYGITGGIPLYMSLIDDKVSVEENIKNNFFSSNAYLFEEPGNLIKQECREPMQYNSIIRAIATGYSKLSEISSKVGIDTSLCTSYINKLTSIGIVKKEMPFESKNIKKGIYKLEDSMFAFWYRFIPQNIALINMGASDKVYNNIKEQIPSYVGYIFEEICKQYLWKINMKDNCLISFNNIGSWWGNNPILKKEEEIDLIATDNNDSAIFVECKWKNEKVDIEVLDTLIEKSKIFNYKNNYFYIFSKSGFKESLENRIRGLSNVKLIEYKYMTK